MDTDSSNTYLMENILTDGHCFSPYTCKCCIVFKQRNGLNFDSLAGKCQKRRNSPHHHHFVLYGMVYANITKDCSQFLVMPTRRTTTDVIALKFS